MFLCMPGSVSMGNECRPLLEGSVDETKIRVVFRLRILYEEETLNTEQT